VYQELKKKGGTSRETKKGEKKRCQHTSQEGGTKKTAPISSQRANGGHMRNLKPRVPGLPNQDGQEKTQNSRREKLAKKKAGHPVFQRRDWGVLFWGTFGRTTLQHRQHKGRKRDLPGEEGEKKKKKKSEGRGGGPSETGGGGQGSTRRNMFANYWGGKYNRTW